MFESHIPRSSVLRQTGTPVRRYSGNGWAESKAWVQHRQLLDSAWALANDKLIRGLGEFQRSELTGAPFDRAVLFYPFGGPDALTATVCFPRSPTYLLVALEPAGTLPTFEHLAK